MLKIIEDKQIMTKNVPVGDYIGRVQKVLNTDTGEITIVNFWYDSNNKLKKVK